MMSANKDQHLAGRNDTFLRTVIAFAEASAKHFVRCHQWPLDVIHAGVDVRHHRR